MNPQEYVDLALEAEYYVEVFETPNGFCVSFGPRERAEIASILKAFMELVKHEFPEFV